MDGGEGQAVGGVVALVALAVAVDPRGFQPQHGGLTRRGGVGDLVLDTNPLHPRQIEGTQTDTAVGGQGDGLLGDRGTAEEGGLPLPQDTGEADTAGGFGDLVGLAVAEIQNGGQITGGAHAVQRADVDIVVALGELLGGLDGEIEARGAVSRGVGDPRGGQIGSGEDLQGGDLLPFSRHTAARGDPHVEVIRNTLVGGHPARGLYGLSHLQLQIPQNRDFGVTAGPGVELIEGVVVGDPPAVVGGGVDREGGDGQKPRRQQYGGQQYGHSFPRSNTHDRSPFGLRVYRDIILHFP